jgi:hypothetical protein
MVAAFRFHHGPVPRRLVGNSAISTVPAAGSLERPCCFPLPFLPVAQQVPIVGIVMHAAAVHEVERLGVSYRPLTPGALGPFGIRSSSILARFGTRRKVTRSTRPARTSWDDWSGRGFMLGPQDRLRGNRRDHRHRCCDTHPGTAMTAPKVAEGKGAHGDHGD